MMESRQDRHALLGRETSGPHVENGYGSVPKVGAKPRAIELACAPAPSPPPTYRFLCPFYFNIFFSCAGFSIVMPSLAPYLLHISAPLAFVPWAVSTYAVGEMVGSVLFGWYYEWAQERGRIIGRPAFGPRSSVMGCIAFGIVGSAIYCARSPVAVLCGRFVQGVWTGGQQTVEQAYLSAAVGQDKRVDLTATLSSFAVLGFVVGPSFGAALSGLNVEVMGLLINADNSPGAFIFIVTIIMMVQTALFFDGMESSEEIFDDSFGDSSTKGQRHERYAPYPPSRNRSGLFVCIWLFFVHYYSFAVQETITTPLVMHLYDWSLLEVNLLFVGIGILSLVASVAVKYLSHVVEDRMMLIMSVFVGLTGSTLLIDSPLGPSSQGETGSFGNRIADAMPLWRFLTGFSLVTIAFPFGRNVTLGVFGNLLGTRCQGRRMGLILAVGTIPRIFGPFSAVWALEAVRWRTWLEFGSVSVLFVVAFIVSLVFFTKLVPLDSDPEVGNQSHALHAASTLLKTSPHSPILFEQRGKARRNPVRNMRPKVKVAPEIESHEYMLALS